mgnify:CR=1 FL=1
MRNLVAGFPNGHKQVDRCYFGWESWSVSAMGSQQKCCL